MATRHAHTLSVHIAAIAPVSPSMLQATKEEKYRPARKFRSSRSTIGIPMSGKSGRKGNPNARAQTQASKPKSKVLRG